MPAPLSLKGRGLQMLAQRDQSRSELRRKLMAHAAVAVQTAAGVADGDAAALRAGLAEQVEAVLDWLQERDYLSDERFIESRVRTRAPRFGNLRIRHELAQHGVALSPEASRTLKETEVARAREVWRRKFGLPAADAAGRARQARFLAARGFSGEVIRQVIQGTADD